MGGNAQAFTFTDSLENAQEAMDGFQDPSSGFTHPPFDFIGPSPVYFKMNKNNLSVVVNAAHSLWFVGPDLFAETPFVVFGDSPRDTWNSDDPQFADLGHESSSGYSSKPQPAGKTKIVPVETLLQALQTFAGALVARGFKTGKGTLLGQLTVFIVALVNKRPIDMSVLEVLLQKIESALK